ncbi:flagellar basal body rod C-terminal domain-containing protein [Desulfovibrionales bacterium]
MSEHIQALDAFATSMQVTANNLANINTNGFHSQRVDLESGPGDKGVRVQDIVENTQSGPLVPRLDERTGEDVMVEGSNVDVATEMTQMIQDERAFEANAVALASRERMIGQFIDEMV